jgi:hypothetical protein
MILDRAGDRSIHRRMGADRGLDVVAPGGSDA